jgi:hypothetical protein
MIAKTLFILGAVGVSLIAFGMGVELLVEYWYVPVAAGGIWLIWRLRNDHRGGYTNKSPERFSRDYREVRKGRG